MHVLLALFVLLELSIQQVGWSFTAMADPLASGLVTAVVGAIGLGIYTVWRTKRLLPFRSLTPYDRVIVGRLAAGILIVNVAYVYGVQSLGIGTIATMTAVGPLCINGSKLWTIWRFRKKMPTSVLRDAAWSIALRGVMFVGVVVVNKPWVEFRDFRMEMLVGVACGVLGAWSFWNYLRCFYDEHYSKEERLRIVAVADLLALPIIAVAVWGMSFVVGGGYAELSPRVLALGAIAGILSFLIPTIMGAWVVDKISVTWSSMLYLLDSPLGTLVGLAGASMGALGQQHAPGFWGWVGMAIVVVAAGAAKFHPIPNQVPAHDGPSLKEGR